MLGNRKWKVDYEEAVMRYEEMRNEMNSLLMADMLTDIKYTWYLHELGNLWREAEKFEDMTIIERLNYK